jgi:hypothetical protein
VKRAEHQPVTIGLKIYAGIWCKVYRVPDAGTVLPMHAHQWPHLTMLVSGAIHVERNGVREGRYKAPALIEIPARELHSFTTLAPDVVLACIHNVDHLEADEPAIHATHDLELED